MNKRYSEKTFEINKNLHANCWSENTSYGFRHLAELRLGWQTIATAKRTYYNRTWESYEFESVLETLFEKADSLTDSEKRAFKKCIKNGGEHELDNLKTISTIASLGDIFTDTPKQANDWKTRILKAGLLNKGLIMPEDWEQLSEEEKEKRLNGAIEAIS